MATRRKPRSAFIPLKAGLSVLAVGLFLLVAVLATRASVGAAGTELAVSGTLGLTSDGRMVLDDGSTTYYLVSAVPLSPYLGKTVVLGGTYDGDALFVRELTLGAIHALYQDGAITLTTTGTVEGTADGFEVTTEGVSFTLVESDQLGAAVGQVSTIEGELLFDTVVAVTSVTAEG